MICICLWIEFFCFVSLTVLVRRIKGIWDLIPSGLVQLFVVSGSIVFLFHLQLQFWRYMVPNFLCFFSLRLMTSSSRCEFSFSRTGPFGYLRNQFNFTYGNGSWVVLVP